MRRAGACLVAVAMICFSPRAAALDELCEQYLEEQAPSDDSSIRETIARFAPTLEVTAWLRVADHGDDRARVDHAAVSPPPTEGDSDADAREARAERRRSFRWEVTLSWDVLDMIDTDPAARPLPSNRPELAECQFDERSTEALREEAEPSTQPGDLSDELGDQPLRQLTPETIEEPTDDTD